MIRRALVLAYALLALSAAAAPAALAAPAVKSGDIGFVNSSIWFSKASFSAGDQVKIYTTVRNASSAELRGTVAFYANESVIGTSDFSLASGDSAVVSATFTAQAGAQAYSARIQNASALLGDGTSQAVAVSGTQPLNVTVAPQAAPTEPQQGAIASLADSLIATLPNDAGGRASSTPVAGQTDRPNQDPEAPQPVATSTVTAVLERLGANEGIVGTPARLLGSLFRRADGALDSAISSLAQSARAARSHALVHATSTAAQQPAASDSVMALLYALFAKALGFKTVIYAMALYLIYKLIRIVCAPR